MDFREKLNKRVEELTLEKEKHIANYNVMIGQFRESQQALAEYDRMVIESTKKKVVTTSKKTPTTTVKTVKTAKTKTGKNTVTKLKKAG